jgi:hypothetical protein
MIVSRKREVWVEITVVSGSERALYEAAFRHAMKSQVRLARQLGGIAVVAGIGATVWFFAGQHSIGMLLFAGTLVAFGYFYIRSASLARPRSLHNLGRQQLRERTYTLTDDWLIIEGPYGRSQISWYAYRKAVELPGMVLLTSGRSVITPVPTADLAPEQLQQLRTFLAGRDWAADLPGQTRLDRAIEMPWST